MMKQISFTEAQGNTFLGNYSIWPEGILLVFSNGFVHLVVQTGCDNDNYLSEEPFKLGVNDTAAINAGIATQEEVNEARRVREEKYNSLHLVDERREYDRLREKFEGK
jgi:hypothetical protein